MGQRIPYVGQPISGVNPPVYRQVPSGGTYPLSAGQYIIELGRQMAVQWYNVLNKSWNNLFAGPGTFPVTILSDGQNYRVANLSGTILGAVVTNAGTGYLQSSTALSFAAPASGITATGVPVVGGDLVLTIVSGGTNYTNPTLQIDAPWVNNPPVNMNSQNVGGPYVPVQPYQPSLPAYANASLTSGVITSTAFAFAGAGYIGIPNVTVSDPTGSGAVITAAIGTAHAAEVTGIIITNGGSGYDGTHIPAVTFTGAGSSAAATALPSMSMKSVTINSGGAFSTGTPILITDGGIVYSSVNGESLPFRPFIGAGTLTTGAISAVVTEDEGTGFQTVPLIGAINTSTIASGEPSLTPVVGGVNSYLRLWQVG